MSTFSKSLRSLFPEITKNSQVKVSPFLSVPYKVELQRKQKALNTYFAKELGEISLFESPKDLNYRTTSKRRVHFHPRKGISFDLGKEIDGRKVTLSPLEPEIHSEIYEFLFEFLKDKRNLSLAKSTSWVILRSSGEDVGVIFNLRSADRERILILRVLAKQLSARFKNLKGLALYCDPSASDYFLEMRTPPKKNPYKNIWGDDFLALQNTPLDLRFPLSSFSQINEHSHQLLLTKTGELLGDGNGGQLLDLYCGYGFFALHFADRFDKVLGVEFKGESISQAQRNAKYLGLDQVKFQSGFIDKDLIEKIPLANCPEYVLLDPPRQGTQNGVIEAIAQRRPQKVIHLFCGTDRVLTELEEWKKCGYSLKKSIALDLFPRTDSIEIALLLEATE